MNKWHLIGWISEWNNYQLIVKISVFETNVRMTQYWQRQKNDRDILIVLELNFQMMVVPSLGQVCKVMRNLKIGEFKIGVYGEHTWYSFLNKVQGIYLSFAIIVVEKHVLCWHGKRILHGHSTLI